MAVKKEKEPKCNNCIYFIDDVCHHQSNIKILVQKRIEKQEFISKELKMVCKNVQPKA